MELAPGTMVNANVRLIELLGQGGMGSVWLADHLGLESKVAVKFMSPELVGREPSLGERFKNEARICAKLRSIHVVQTFDHGRMADGRPYIVMELLQGRTLTERVETQGRRPLREVGMIVAQVSKVLHRAHGLGIVHRDIKPDNIFLTQDSDYDLLVKVLDFGIAKNTHVSGEVVTKTGAIVGSPEFMSPEQAINSKDVDHRSDLFSLGVVAYYALTNELPFDEDENNPWWLQLTSGQHIRATKRVPELPPRIDSWFATALAPKPPDRFQSARDMSDALASIVDPGHAAGLADLSSSIDDSVKLPPTLDLLSDPRLDVLAEQKTVKLIRPRSEPPPPHPPRDPFSTAPTLLAESRDQLPPWATPQPKRSPTLMVVAIVATLALAAIIAVLIHLGVIPLGWGAS